MSADLRAADIAMDLLTFESTANLGLALTIGMISITSEVLVQRH